MPAAHPVSLLGWCGLLATASVALSIVVATLRTGIGPMPSSRRACRAMIEAAADAPAGTVLELGSGWGQLAIGYARAHPQRTVIGYELSLLPWLVASGAARALRLSNLSFRRMDYRSADWPGAGLLLCYLYRSAMRELSATLARVPHGELLVVSNSFALPAHRAASVHRLDDWQRTRIEVYRIAAARPDFASAAGASHGPAGRDGKSADSGSRADQPPA